MPSIKIEGMHCENCRSAVLKALGALPGLDKLEVTLQPGEASWQDKNPAAPANVELIKETVRDLGFEA